jgi:hypothetical protein
MPSYIVAREVIRQFMKKFIALCLCLSFPLASFAADNSYKIAYDGGSLPDAKAGMEMKLFIEGDKIRITKDKGDVIVIPAASVTEISAAIGLAVISFGIGALMALTKSKKHFVGLTWDDNGKKGGCAFQADKNDYRGLLAGLEGITGKKAVDSDAMTVKN